jgi:hypothetical protein
LTTNSILPRGVKWKAKLNPNVTGLLGVVGKLTVKRIRTLANPEE